MGCIYLPNGIPFDAWKPEATDGKVTRLNPWLASFEPHRQDLQFLTGLQSDSNQTHQAGSATWLLRPCPEGEYINQTRDVGGTSMDQSMILYGSPFADGHDHQSTMLPMLIAGRAGGKIRPGRMLEYPDGPAEGVYLSMMDIMGVAIHEIGGIDKAIPIT